MQVSGGLVVTPEGVRGAEIFVEGEKIAALHPPGREFHRTLDATGCYVLPGGIDPHTHLFTDVAPAGRAAAEGGTTTAISFTLPEAGEPVVDALTRGRDDLVPQAGIDVALHAYVSAPDALTAAQIEEVAGLGATGIKLFTAYKELGLQASDRNLFETMRSAAPLGLPVLVHCENGDVIDALVDELLAEGKREAPFFAASRPPEVEEEAVQRVLALGGIAGALVYVVHVSTAGGLASIRAARARGQAAWAEACAHHLAFDASVYEGPDPVRYLTVPPLRERGHVDALWEGVRSGEVDTIGSDHSQVRFQPPAADDFTGLPYGLAGARYRLPVLLALGRARGIPLERLADLVATNAARIFGLWPRKGAIREGADADLVVWDPDAEWTIDDPESPYEGLRLQGRIRAVVARGAPLVQDGDWVGGKPEGRFLPK